MNTPKIASTAFLFIIGWIGFLYPCAHVFKFQPIMFLVPKCDLDNVRKIRASDESLLN